MDQENLKIDSGELADMCINYQNGLPSITVRELYAIYLQKFFDVSGYTEEEMMEYYEYQETEQENKPLTKGEFLKNYTPDPAVFVENNYDKDGKPLPFSFDVFGKGMYYGIKPDYWKGFRVFTGEKWITLLEYVKTMQKREVDKARKLARSAM